ncbi:unnamed protein product, partial [Musa acuminata subsp. burmannicoides]
MSLPWISSPFAACSVTQFGVPSLKKMESFILIHDSTSRKDSSGCCQLTICSLSY